MDILEFVARSEWPLVAGGAIYLVRRQLQALIGRVNVTKIDAWGLKAEFEQGLDKVEKKLAPATGGQNETIVHLEGTFHKVTAGEIIAKGERIMHDLGGRMMPTPETLILEAWNRFEKELFEAAGLGDPEQSSNRFRRTHRILSGFGLTENDREAFTIMYDLREKVAQTSTPFASWGDVMRFGEVLDGIVQRVKLYREEHPE